MRLLTGEYRDFNMLQEEGFYHLMAFVCVRERARNFDLGGRHLDPPHTSLTMIFRWQFHLAEIKRERSNMGLLTETYRDFNMLEGESFPIL